MTPLSQTIEIDEPAQFARKLMLHYGVSYLPVTYDGRVVGIVSHKFLHYLATSCLLDLNIHVKDLMEHDFHRSKETSTISQVANELFLQRKDVSIVFSHNHDQLVGILSSLELFKMIGVPS